MDPSIWMEPWSCVSNLSPFLSLPKVVDATSPARADAGDPQRITARPVSKHEPEGWKMKGILVFFFSCGEILYILLSAALKYFSVFPACFYQLTFLFSFPCVSVFFFPLLCFPEMLKLTWILFSLPGGNMGIRMGILEYTEMNIAGIEESTRWIRSCLMMAWHWKVSNTRILLISLGAWEH